ncbi:MAG: hypothetical protein IH595_11035 [Bacteroidales bacterium]|nr:hypothetical protein [Bacteroidales bacterium]
MKFLRFALVLTLALTFTSYSAFAKRKDKGQIAYEQGNYAEALKIWAKEINIYVKRNKAVKCPYYTKAGVAALKLGKSALAQKYLENARYTASENATTYNDLAHIYRKINNLSKEMDALDNYVKKYPNGKDIVANRNRLFMTNIEATNWQEALDLWPKLPDTTRANIEYRSGLLQAYVGLNKAKVADTLAESVLKVQPKNVPALDYLAQKYFWLAENSYIAENKAYAANRTNQQYAHLLQAYKVISRNYELSLAYFKTLFPLERTAKNAVFIGDIYSRMNSPKKAAYYQDLAKKLK